MRTLLTLELATHTHTHIHTYTHTRTHARTSSTLSAAQSNPSYVASDDPVGSEDHCLELDIYVAEGVTNAKSVLMYIHGGAHDFGKLLPDLNCEPSTLNTLKLNTKPPKP